MNHKCGICGFSAEKNAELFLYKMLLQLQHRGQLSSGITTFHPNDPMRLRTHKDLGLVNTVFRAEHNGKFLSIMKNHSSGKGIGHVRYATSGADDKTYAQPFERPHGRKNKWFSFCFNGNIANYSDLKTELENDNYHLVRDTDTEIIMHLLSKSIKESGSLFEAFNGATERLDGAFNIAFLNAEGSLAATRDPFGFRPLCYAFNGENIAFASESIALSSIGFSDILDLKPGEMILSNNGHTEVESYTKSPKSAFCFFEWVYFAHPASVIEGVLVYKARHGLGIELASLETQKIDKDCIVVPVPDSSRPVGEGFAEKLDLPCIEGLIRNRYLGRTFIESNDRAQKVKDKFTVVRQVIEGKKIFLVDDSIVRGTTMKNLIVYIKKVGKPKEIHVRVSCPPIMWPCFYGIDMSSRSELIAAKYGIEDNAVENIRIEIGADSLIYQTQKGLIRGIGMPKDSLCLACLNGEYPTKMGEKLKLFCGSGRACTDK
ncbi:MAG: amidophosphoribosyltransferase [Candidatus Diapherotrites archaeon]|nr:amidophosphoribosyltransferase [Candidatus Diapherotrites archaeon]